MDFKKINAPTSTVTYDREKKSMDGRADDERTDDRRPPFGIPPPGGFD